MVNRVCAACVASVICSVAQQLVQLHDSVKEEFQEQSHAMHYKDVLLLHCCACTHGTLIYLQLP